MFAETLSGNGLRGLVDVNKKPDCTSRGRGGCDLVLFPWKKSGMSHRSAFRCQSESTSELNHETLGQGAWLGSDSEMFVLLVNFKVWFVLPPFSHPWDNCLCERFFSDEFLASNNEAIFESGTIELFKVLMSLDLIWILLLCDCQTTLDVLDICKDRLVEFFQLAVSFSEFADFCVHHSEASSDLSVKT